MGGGGEGLYPLPAPIPSTLADFSRDISENIHDVRFALLPIQLKLQSTWRAKPPACNTSLVALSAEMYMPVNSNFHRVTIHWPSLREAPGKCTYPPPILAFLERL